MFPAGAPVQFEADLDAIFLVDGVQTGPVGDAVEETDGAYLPVNDDDDDYNGVADHAQGGGVQGENDLVPIVLRKVQGVQPQGEYSLNIPTHLVVWRFPNRTGLVTTASTFNAAVETKLYAEAIAEGVGFIDVNWGNGGQFVQQADRLKAVGFRFAGAHNVPGHAAYVYTAKGGAAGLGNSKFLAPVGGSLVSAVDNPNPDPGDEIKVKWDSGPVVGKVRYQPGPGWIFPIDVNVVEVTIKPGAVLDFQNPPIQGPNDPRQVLSVDRQQPNAAAMKATLVVERIRGPVDANGQMRGVRHIEMGFIKNVRTTQKNVEFDGDPLNTADNKKRQSSLVDGQWHLAAC